MFSIGTGAYLFTNPCLKPLQVVTYRSFMLRLHELKPNKMLSLFLFYSCLLLCGLCQVQTGLLG